MKVIEQYFHVVLFIMLYKGARRGVPANLMLGVNFKCWGWDWLMDANGTGTRGE